MMPASTTIEEARAKACIYAFLADVFTSHPNPDTVRRVRQMAAELGIACPNGFSLDNLEREYMTLFVVPNPRYVAPYESVFLDRWPLPIPILRGSDPSERGNTIKGPVMGESTLKVRRYFLQAGVLPDTDLPDHIGNELRLMAYLWAKAAEASGGKAQLLAELREKFRQEHLLKWIGSLREKVEENDQLGYYSVAVQLAEIVLQEIEP